MTVKEKFERIVEICELGLKFNDLQDSCMLLIGQLLQNGPSLTAQEIYLGVNVGKIAAIKAYKERTYRSLTDSKFAVEEHFKNAGLRFNSH